MIPLTDGESTEGRTHVPASEPDQGGLAPWLDPSDPPGRGTLVSSLFHHKRSETALCLTLHLGLLCLGKPYQGLKPPTTKLIGSLEYANPLTMSRRWFSDNVRNQTGEPILFRVVVNLFHILHWSLLCCYNSLQFYEKVFH